MSDNFEFIDESEEPVRSEELDESEKSVDDEETNSTDSTLNSKIEKKRSKRINRIHSVKQKNRESKELDKTKESNKLNKSKKIPEFPWKIKGEEGVKIQRELDHISKILSRDYSLKIYPELKDVFKAFELVEQNNINVVIVGQDPYFNGVANGIAFATDNNTLTFSLNTIYKELQKELEENFDVNKPKYKELLKKIKENKSGDLTSWAKQGVLLLNFSLTVFEESPGSHEFLWTGFIRKIIRYINRITENTVFMLWGSKAATLENLLDTNKHLVLKASHPASQAYNFKKDSKTFLGCNHFIEANRYLKLYKKFQIDWYSVFK